MIFMCLFFCVVFFFFSSRRRHTRLQGDWSSDVCSSDLRSWGVTTQRADTVFVHVLDWSDPTLALPSLGGGRWKARMWPSGVPLAVTQSANGVTLTLPSGGDTPDRIVALTK